MTMTRTELRDKLDELAAREARIWRWRRPLLAFTDWLHKPFRVREDAIEEHRDELLAAHHTQIIGQCETCDAIILDGDAYSNGGDGMKLCRQHAPTWSELAQHYRDLLSFNDVSYGEFDADEIRQWLADAEKIVAEGRGGETTASP